MRASMNLIVSILPFAVAASLGAPSASGNSEMPSLLVQDPKPAPPATELIEESYPDGKPKLRREVKRDKDGIVNHGSFQRWYDNGVLEWEGRFVDGQPDGRHTKHFRNGNLKDETDYALGRRSGKHIEYFDLGGVKLLQNFKDGELDGPFEDYTYGPKKLFKKGSYKAGLEDGAWQVLDEKGAVTLEGSFKLGKKVGPWITRFPSGKKKMDEVYVDGVLDGALREFAENGQVISDAHYKLGLAEGLRSEWYETGKKKSEVVFVRGKANGKSINYYETEQKQAEGEMRDGKRVGRWTFWNADGSVNAAWTGNYQDDKRIGD